MHIDRKNKEEFMEGNLKIPGTLQITFSLDNAVQGSKTTWRRMDNASAYIEK